MKLRYSPTSPYVRKVLVCAIERNLDAGIERITTNTADPKNDLPSVNPLGKVPALILDGGEVLYDSPVICEYLDSLHKGQPLIPLAGPARWTVLRRQALADGILDAAILRMLETVRRPEALRWPTSIELQSGKMKRGVEALNKEAPSFGGSVDLGTIAVGCALGYLDFRFAADNWRNEAPALASWYEGFAQRPAMQRTRPPEGA
jgi:glutathione S-transferase